MVGFIFGILFILTGIVCFGVFLSYKDTTQIKQKVRDENGVYIVSRIDMNGDPVYKTEYTTVTNKPLKPYSVLSLIGGIVLGCLLIFFGCICNVDTGNTGVVTTFGRVEDFTYEAGFHMKAPWNKVTEMDNRVQKSTIELSCFSKDIQEVSMRYTLNYQIDKTNAQLIYSTIGTDYYSTIIEPTIAESVKVATAQYTAEQLVQTRSDLATSVENILEESLKKYNIKVSSTAIEDMDFTDSFTNAVESKQVAEQKKKQAIIEQEQALLQAENEKQITETKAKAEAEVAKIKAEADMEVAKIEADSAEYQGRKQAMIRLQALASINGWTVIEDTDTKINKLYKADGTEVTAEELSEGTQKLIEYYYTQTWDGVLPETYVGDGNISSILINKN